MDLSVMKGLFFHRSARDSPTHHKEDEQSDCDDNILFCHDIFVLFLCPIIA